MTTHGTRILAGSLLVAHGIPEERAETILRAFTAADLDIVKRPPAEPQTGPKAEPTTRDQHIAEAKAAIKAARIKTSTATTTEEQP